MRKKLILMVLLLAGAFQAQARPWFYQCEFMQLHMWARADFAWKFVHEDNVDLNEDTILGTCSCPSTSGAFCLETKDDKGLAIQCNKDNLGAFVLTN